MFEISVLRALTGCPLRRSAFRPDLFAPPLASLPGHHCSALIDVSNLPEGITRADIAFSLALSFGYNLLLGVNDLLGPGVLFRLRRRASSPPEA